MEDNTSKSLKIRIKEMKKTSRGRAILKLVRWSIFFLILLVFFIISAIIESKTNNLILEKPPLRDEQAPSQVEEEVLTKEILKTKINELSSSQYQYSYDIIIGNERYAFMGQKENNIFRGYKESNEGILKYYIDDTGVYQETLTDKILIDNLYQNIDLNYLNFDYVYQLLENLEYKINNNHNCIYPLYECADEINFYRVHFGGSVSFKDNYISSIEIVSLNNLYSYTLNFADVRGE